MFSEHFPLIATGFTVIPVPILCDFTDFIRILKEGIGEGGPMGH